MPTENSVRPLLRWAGSKRKLVPRLRRFWQPGFKRYIEPFAGSACLFYELQPSVGLLSDKNSDLIDTYQIVTANPAKVFDGVEALPRDATTYYAQRRLNPSKLGRITRAVRFIYLNRNCFNGIYRTNCDGKFNVPFSDSRTGALLTRDEFIESVKVLKRATFTSCDFGSALANVRKDDFVYLDPPYAIAARRVFREYGPRMFDTADLDRLSKHLARIDKRKAYFVVSYADSAEARKLARPWRSCKIRTRRHVAGFAGARRAAFEHLITNISVDLRDVVAESDE